MSFSKYFSIIIIAYMFCFVYATQAQQIGAYSFTTYGTKEGIPQEDVICIYQDLDGYMWFGTYTGVARYNGRNFTVFTTKEGLLSNTIYDIVEDHTKQIFFATLGGVSVLKSDSFVNVLSGAEIIKIVVDSLNRKWFISRSEIYLYDKGDSLGTVSSIFQNIEGKLQSLVSYKDIVYIGTDKHIYACNYTDKTVKEIVSVDANYMHISNDNLLWVNGLQNMLVFTINQNDSLCLNEPINELLLQTIEDGSNIKKIFKGNDCSVWIQANLHWLRVLPNRSNIVKYSTESGLSEAKMYSFLDDREDVKWFGYAGGIAKLSNEALHLFEQETLTSYINIFFEDIKNRMWMSSESNVFCYDKGELTNYSDLYNFSEDFTPTVAVLPNHNILITHNEAFIEIDVTTLRPIRKHIFSESISYIEDIFVTTKGEVFILTGEEGVYHSNSTISDPTLYDSETVSVVYHLTEFQDEIIGCNQNGIIRFTEDDFEQLYNFGFVVWTLANEDDKLWIGSAEGLGFLDNGKYKAVAPDIFSSDVNAIKLASQKGYLWIGTNNGLSYLNTQTEEVLFTLTSYDGLTSSEIAIDALYIDSQDVLWIGTFHGVMLYEINKRPNKPAIPICRLQRLYLNGKEIDALPNTILPYNQNNLTFYIVGLSFVNEQTIEYQFFMEGLANDFQASTGKEFKAVYSNLPPARYNFKYRAKTKDGVWSNYNSVPFTIDKPYYRKWWFVIFVALSTVAIVWFIFRLRTASLKRQKEHLEQIVRQRTAEIEQQKEEILTQADYLRDLNEQIVEQHNKIEESYLNIKLLSEIGKEITMHLKVQEIADNVYIHINTLMEADIFGLGILQSKDNQIAMYCSSDGHKQSSKPIFIAGDNKPNNYDLREYLATHCINAQEEIVTNSKRELKRYIKDQHFDTNNIPSSMVYIPITISERKIGLITVQSFQENGFADYHIDILQNLAIYIGIALLNAESFEHIEKQKAVIQNKNTEITESINYAYNIQTALLPSANDFLLTFDQHFILNKPRDIVSGDFYWSKKVEDKLIFAVADCTGHGVPGAFMSMLGIALLNQLVTEDRTRPASILNILRLKIKELLHQRDIVKDAKDGMDIGICTLNTKDFTTEFAGAYRPVYIITDINTEIEAKRRLDMDNKTLLEISGDHMPIGIYPKEHPFTNYNFKLSKGDLLYLFTDGYSDQVGGEKGRKYTSRIFKQTLLNNQSIPMLQQKELLNNIIDKWMHDEFRQVDDMLILGIRI